MQTPNAQQQPCLALKTRRNRIVINPSNSGFWRSYTNYERSPKSTGKCNNFGGHKSLPEFNRCRIYCYPLAFLSTAQDFWLLLVTKVTNKKLHCQSI